MKWKQCIRGVNRRDRDTGRERGQRKGERKKEKEREWVRENKLWHFPPSAKKKYANRRLKVVEKLKQLKFMAMHRWQCSYLSGIMWIIIHQFVQSAMWVLRHIPTEKNQVCSMKHLKRRWKAQRIFTVHNGWLYEETLEQYYTRSFAQSRIYHPL